MQPGESEIIAPALHEAQRVAERTLAEACATTPVSEADTGELIHIDELLAAAGDAVKRTISLRRRRRADEAARQAARAAMVDLEAEASADGTHRIFRDARGTRWDVFAVRPDARRSAQWQLDGSYGQGWLCFDSPREKRRVSPIPSGWFSLSNEQLERLVQGAEVAATGGAPRGDIGTDDRPSSG